MSKIIILAALIFTLPLIGFAATSTPTSTPSSTPGASQVVVGGNTGGVDLSGLQYGIPGGKYNSKDPAGIVANLYEFALLVGGILAFGSIVYGGVQYLMTAGNTSAQHEAKDRIRDALIGLLLLVGVYFVMNIVSPDLTKLRFPTMLPIPEATSTDLLSYLRGTNPLVRSDDKGRVLASDPAADIWACQTNDSKSTTKVCYATQAACDADCEKFMDSSGVDAEGLGPTDGKCVAAKANTCPGIDTIEPGQCKSGDCVPIDLPWQFKNGSTADQAMVNTLKCIAGKGVSLRITEAMPPSSPHQSTKHNNGCAVDATLPSIRSSADCNQICDLKDKLETCGGTLLNEYFNLCGQAACKGRNTELSTGEHVHITSCLN